MAYVIGKKVVKDTEEFGEYAYGITLPISKGETGYYKQAFNSIDQARTNLLNLLLTNRGERIMQPDFGTGLQRLLFEQMVDSLEDEITDEITTSVNFWLPYINIEEIEVEMTDSMKDNHIANMKVKFTVGSNIELQEITFTIQG